MEADPAALPDDITVLKAALIAERARADAGQAEAAIARARQSDAEALVAAQKLEIEKLKREIYGPRSERARRLIDQLEFELEELEATATEDELRAEQDVAKATTVTAFSRKRPARKPFPEHLPRERVVVPGPAAPRVAAARVVAVALAPRSQGTRSMSSRIAVLKVTLDGVKPTVMRRLVVPSTIRLDRLHLVLQAAIGWTNSHLYEFTARGVGWGIPDPDFGVGPLDAKKARLIDVLEDCGVKTLNYLYDFGDGWEHTVKVERIENAIPGLTSPFLVEAVGRCPPEDVGGPSGYEEFLEIMSNAEHDSYAETRQWVGGPFDPRAADLTTLSHAVDALATKWSRPATTRKTRSHI